MKIYHYGEVLYHQGCHVKLARTPLFEDKDALECGLKELTKKVKESGQNEVFIVKHGSIKIDCLDVHAEENDGTRDNHHP